MISVNVSFQVADALLALATLSHLGLGVRPPASDWGDMVGGGIRYLYDGYWWEVYPAGVAIVLAVVAFNLLGDGLREGLAGPHRIRCADGLPGPDGGPSAPDAASLLVLDVAGRGPSVLELADAMRSL